MMYSYFYVIYMCMYLLQLCRAHYSQQWAVHIHGGDIVADQVARDHGFINLGKIFDDHYHFTHPGVTKRSTPNLGKKLQLAADTRVRWAQQQLVKKRVKRDLRLQDSDPRWPSMWYLNRGNGLDMNVIPAWLEGVTGKGAVVTILDDGLEKDHPDLVKNYDPMASYDVNNHDSDPSPRYDMIDSNRHGTRCAGEVAATSNNSVCALGVAHGAQVGGVRMLDGDVTDAVEARSLSLNPQHIDIYSASWGPDDDGKTVDGPGELATRAFIEGVTKGRNGKGSIFVWASGNGGRDHDNCNCDGYTNSIYSLSISSATEQGHVPWYSEACSSTLASTYSSGAVGERQVVTTDLHHSCTSSHTGTSASAPLAAGICALALEANPNLTWRDMQHIVVRTARPQHLVTPDWQTNGVGRNVSHSFGYGLMDAYAMVQLARKWVTVPEQHKCEIAAPHVQKSIPAKSVVVLQLQVLECEGVQVLEHVQAKLTIFSQRRGDLHIQLTSPMGTRVTLLAHRGHDIARSGFNHWPFMSVHSWGEAPFGTWQLEIHNDGRMLAEIEAWDLILYGTASPPKIEEDEKIKPVKSNIEVDEINHNSLDVNTPNESWRSDAEIRKDTSVLEGELLPVNAAQNCARSNGEFCLGLFVTLMLCYTYFRNIFIFLTHLIWKFILQICANINLYTKKKNVCKVVAQLKCIFLENRKFQNYDKVFFPNTSSELTRHNEFCTDVILNRPFKNVQLYSVKCNSNRIDKIISTKLRKYISQFLENIIKFHYLKTLVSKIYQTNCICDMAVDFKYNVRIPKNLVLQTFRLLTKILRDIMFGRMFATFSLLMLSTPFTNC